VPWIEARATDTKSAVAHPAEGTDLGRHVRLFRLKVGPLRWGITFVLIFHRFLRAGFFRASFLDISKPELQAGDISERLHPFYLIIRLVVPILLWPDIAVEKALGLASGNKTFGFPWAIKQAGPQEFQASLEYVTIISSKIHLCIPKANFRRKKGG
jgi:hypothetical protein